MVALSASSSDTGLEYDKEGHVVGATGTLNADNQAVQHFRYILDHAVDFAAAHTNTFAVDGRIGAAIDDGAASRRDFDPVAVPPDARIHLKVALVVAFALRVVPEEKRHGGHGFGDDQFANFINKWLPALVEGFDFSAQRATLEFPGEHRQQDAAAQEARTDIRAATVRGQPQVGFDLLINPLEALRRQRRAGRTESAQLAQVEALARRDACFHAGQDVARAGAKKGHARLLGELP